MFEPRASDHRLCLPCWRTDHERSIAGRAYQRGYADGLADARRRRAIFAPVEPALITAAIGLCHLDRHPVERHAAANDVKAALLAPRERITGQW